MRDRSGCLFADRAKERASSQSSSTLSDRLKPKRPSSAQAWRSTSCVTVARRKALGSCPYILRNALRIRCLSLKLRRIVKIEKRAENAVQTGRPKHGRIEDLVGHGRLRHLSHGIHKPCGQ